MYIQCVYMSKFYNCILHFFFMLVQYRCTCTVQCYYCVWFCRTSGAAPDSLKYEEDTFQQLEKNVYHGIRKALQGNKKSLHHLGQIFYPKSPSLEPSSLSYHSLTMPRRKKQVPKDVTKSASPSASPRTHSRIRSDISDLVKIHTEEGLREEGEYDQEEVIAEEAEEDSLGDQEEKVEVKKLSDPLIPSIDLEVNVTIHIDSGSIVLHSEDVG